MKSATFLLCVTVAMACVDDPTGEIKKAGASCTMLKGMGCDTDINTLNPDTPKGTFVSMVCPVSCDACDDSKVEDTPTKMPTTSCVDDPTGDIKKAGASCTMLKGMGCDTDINSMNPDTPKGTFVKMLCPVSCNTCANGSAGEGSEAEAMPCVDDPTGDIEKSGASCTMLKIMGCDTDLSTMSPDVPKDTFVKALCPVSCGACASGTEAEEVDDKTYFEANGYVFRCSVSGSQDAPNKVLFLHGFPEWGRHWKPIQTAWENQKAPVHSVACDLRGYSPGASPDDIKEYAYDNFVDDAWAIADAAGFDKFHVVGHDHGAGAGWVLSAQDKAKDRLLSYTAISVPHPDTMSDALYGPNIVEAQAKSSNYVNEFKQPDSSKKGMWGLLRSMAGFETSAGLQKALWWYNNNPYMANPDYVENPGGLSGMARSAIGAPAEPYKGSAQIKRVGNIHAPVLFICGSKDEYIRCDLDYVKGQEKYAVEGYTNLSFESCGHSLFDCEDQKDNANVIKSILSFVLTGSAKEESTCPKQAFMLVNGRFTAQCFDSSMPLARTTSCKKQKFYLSKTGNSVHLHNKDGKCLGAGRKFVNCKTGKGLFKLVDAGNGSFHISNGMCLNLLNNKGVLAPRKCNKKIRSQTFFATPILD